MEISNLICLECLRENSMQVMFTRRSRLVLKCTCGTVIYPDSGRAVMALQVVGELIQKAGIEGVRELVDHRMSALRSAGSTLPAYKAPADVRVHAPKRTEMK